MTPLTFAFAALAIAGASLAVWLWYERRRALVERDTARTVYELANDPILVADIVGGRILHTNAAAAQLLGYTGPELLGRSLPELHPHELVDRSAEVIADVWEKKGLVYSDLPFVRKNGERVEVEISANVIQFQLQPALLIYARDMSERRRLQAQLVQSEKMAALGNLVAGVAHELNTPIGAIHSNADVARRAIDIIRKAMAEEPLATAAVGQSRLARALSTLADTNGVTIEASERVTAIVGSLRNFARLDEAERKRVDVHEGIESTLLLLRHELKQNIDVVKDFGPLPDIECFPNRLNQVFMNLLVNAVHAMENGGTITITTRVDGEWAIFEVRDTGRGITPEHLGRVFDPGFTTKGVGVGTGLGLSITYRIVQDHGGTISVASEPGKGATFTVRLPLR